MHGIGQTLSNIVLSIVITMVGVVYGLLNFSESNQQQSANSIVQAALLDASDDNGKVIDGAMVINTSRFEQNIKQSNIDNWHKISRKNPRKDSEMAIGIYYLDDNSKNAHDFHQLEESQQSDRKVIKGVKVIVMRLNKTTPVPAKEKLASDIKSNDPQYGLLDKDHKQISIDDLDQLAKNETVYVTQPTDIITYLISGHGTLKADDIANGIPKTSPDRNQRGKDNNGYLGAYEK